ncbi:MAG TPA: tripartite tricarboxylate transporter substrate binding protein [Burkholderiaceae bacterium]
MLASLRRSAAFAILALATAAAMGQGYPNRPIRLVVPYPPGASTDAVARIVGQKMAEDLGQPVIVDNKGGASGNIGSDFVAKAAPDGYTLLLGTDATHTANYFLFKNFPYDPIRDFTPLTMAAKNIVVLVANPAFPPNNIRELIDYAKKNPGKLSYGSAGTGSPHHLAGALLNQLAGIDIQHVPYKGGGPAANDVLGGQIPMIYASLVGVLQQIKVGKLKVLGVTEKTRYSGLPDVPAIGETVPGFSMSSWLGFFAPAHLPAAIQARLHASLVKALASPEVAAKLNAQGLLVVGDTPEQFAAQQKADFEQRGALVKSIGLQPE